MYGERKDLDELLNKLGWANPYQKNSTVQCFHQYRPDAKKPWEITMFHKIPVWRWDFVMPQRKYPDGDLGYINYEVRPGGWLRTVRSDFEFESLDDMEAVANSINEELLDRYDNDYIDPNNGYWEIAIQRVTERPNRDTLE